jgi:hypothetical protein
MSRGRPSLRGWPLAAIVVALVGLVAAPGSWAWFTTTGTGTGTARVGTLAAPAITTATAGAGTVALSWSAVTPSSGTVTYYVTRVGGGSTSGTCPTSVAPAAVTSCTDTGVAIGAHSYTVTAVWLSWTGTSATASATVTYGALDHFLLNPATGSHTAGSAFSVALTAQDAANNTVANYTGTVHFTSSDTQAVLPADYTFTTGTGADNGAHTFTGGVALRSAGSETVTATGNSKTGTGTYTVTASTAAAISVASGSGQSAAISTAFSNPLVASVVDAYGNPVSGVPVTFTGPSSGAGGSFATCAGGNPQTYACVATTSANGQATSSTFTANGTAAAYPVSASATGAGSTSFSLTNQPGAQTITFGALANKTFDQGPITVSATASSGLAVSFSSATTGVCTVSGTTVSFVAVGTCTIDADQAGNGNWSAGATVAQSFTISKGTQTITFGTLAAKTFDRGPITLGANASSGLAVTYTSTTTAVCTVSGSTVTFVTVGTCTIKADQAGNGNWSAATSVSRSFTISKGTQTITFGTLAAKTFDQGPISVSATASSGLAVTYTSSTTGVCTVSGSTVTLVTTGTCTITADQAGNGNWSAATGVSQSFTISKGAQTITFTSAAPSSATVGGSTYAVSATGGASGSAVTFTIDSSAGSVCSINGSTVSFTGAGTCVIDANQAAGTNYSAAPQAQQSFAVTGTLAISSVARDGGQKKVHFTGTGASASTTITITICSVNSFPCASPIATSAVSSPSAGSWISAQDSNNLAQSQTYYAEAVQGSTTSAVFTFSTNGL